MNDNVKLDILKINIQQFEELLYESKKLSNKNKLQKRIYHIMLEQGKLTNALEASLPYVLHIYGNKSNDHIYSLNIENEKFDYCIFQDIDFTESRVDRSVFNRAIFINVKFSDTQKANSKFINCIHIFENDKGIRENVPLEEMDDLQRSIYAYEAEEIYIKCADINIIDAETQTRNKSFAQKLLGILIPRGLFILALILGVILSITQGFFAALGFVAFSFIAISICYLISRVYFAPRDSGMSISKFFWTLPLVSKIFGKSNNLEDAIEQPLFLSDDNIYYNQSNSDINGKNYRGREGNVVEIGGEVTKIF